MSGTGEMYDGVLKPIDVKETQKILKMCFMEEVKKLNQLKKLKWGAPEIDTASKEAKADEKNDSLSSWDSPEEPNEEEEQKSGGSDESDFDEAMMDYADEQ